MRSWHCLPKMPGSVSSKSVPFDYPQYAHDLFLRAYRKAYQAYSDDLPQGIHPNIYVLAELLEEEVHQTHDHDHTMNDHDHH